MPSRHQGLQKKVCSTTVRSTQSFRGSFMSVERPIAFYNLCHGLPLLILVGSSFSVRSSICSLAHGDLNLKALPYLESTKGMGMSSKAKNPRILPAHW